MWQNTNRKSDVSERLGRSAEAKKALLAKFKPRVHTPDPQFEERRLPFAAALFELWIGGVNSRFELGEQGLLGLRRAAQPLAHIRLPIGILPHGSFRKPL